jgi:hypothetical protein
MKTNDAVDDFRDYLTANVPNVRLDNRGGSRRVKNIVRVIDIKTLKPVVVLWAKRATKPYRAGFWWGINEHQLKELNNGNTPWWLVLLSGQGGRTYVAPASQVNACLQAGEWSAQNDKPEFKINEDQISGKFRRSTTYADIVTLVGL